MGDWWYLEPPAKVDLDLVQDAEVTRGGAWTTGHQILRRAAQPCTQRSVSCRSLTPPGSQPFAFLCSSTMYIAIFCFFVQLCTPSGAPLQFFPPAVEMYHGSFSFSV